MAYYNSNYRAGQRAPQQGMRTARPAGAVSGGRGEAGASCGCASNNTACAANKARETAVSCGCRTVSQTPVNCIVPSPSCPVAMAYVPFQRFEELYDEGKAFMLGTAFPSLFKPFMAGGKCR